MDEHLTKGSYEGDICDSLLRDLEQLAEAART
jgi:hypothetical protein